MSPLLSLSSLSTRRSEVCQSSQNGAALHFGKPRFSSGFRLKQRNDDSHNERQRHGDQAGVLQREVPPLLRDLSEVVLENVDLDGWTAIQQYQGRQRPDNDCAHGAPGGEATPENRQH